MTARKGPSAAMLAARSVEIRRALLSWFRKSARKLPWRTVQRDPWAVWVSEVMLQQTRVATVIPYFEAFMLRYPDVRSMAEAELDEVLSAWSGLGYYRRARALHAGARQVATRFNAEIPSSLEALRTLPGVGDYTAAAIASIAFGVPVAVLDGNVHRVIARLAALREPDDAATPKLHRQLAQALLPSRGAGTFNEAMMELGALVCTPGNPHCTECALQALCEAHALGVEGEIPSPKKRAPSPTVRLLGVVITCGDRLLLARRSTDGLFGGMWDPPLFERPLKPCWRAWLRPTRGRLPAPIAKVRHVLTHRVLQVEVIALEVDEGLCGPGSELPPGYDAVRWMKPRDVQRCGTSSLARRILQAAGARAAPPC